MAVYSVIRDNRTDTLEATETSGSGYSISLLRLKVGRSTTSTANSATRIRFIRSSGGTTPTNYTAEKPNSRSGSPTTTFVGNWATDPNTSGSQLICLPLLFQEPSINWCPPRPWAQAVVQDGEQADVKGSAVTSLSFTLLFAEPDAVFRIERPTRRPRRNGLWSYATEQNNLGKKTGTGAYELVRRSESRYVAYVPHRYEKRSNSWPLFYSIGAPTPKSLVLDQGRQRFRPLIVR